MSVSHLEKVRCPCGETFEAELYQSVTANEDPALKELIVAGELNVVKCPSCFQMIYAERFVLYHDASKELMAFVYPKAMEAQEKDIQSTVGSAFLQLQSELSKEAPIQYKPFLLFGMDTLCALLHAEEEIEDEATVVDFLCQDMKLGKKKIGYDLARRNDLPLVLPLGKGEPSKAASDGAVVRETLITGLKKILDNNPNLHHYKAFLNKIESNADWTLEAGS